MTGIVLLILAILTGTLVVSQYYVRGIGRNNSSTLADSLLQQANNALSIYKDNLRYNAAYMCRFLIIDDSNKGISLRGDEELAQLSSYFSQIEIKNREIASAILFDREMNEIASFGKKVHLPQRQKYLRTGEDLNADWYFGQGQEFNYAYYYPVYNVLDGQGRQAGMCVFILDHWTLDGTARNLLKDYSAAMLLSDSGNLNLSFHTAGDVPENITMQQLKNSEDFIYREGDWQNGIRAAVAVSVTANDSESEVIRRLVFIAYAFAILLLAITLFFSYYQLARPIRGISAFINRAIRHPDERLNLRREDEIGVVAESLDHMLDENQKMIQEIKDGKVRLYETQLARQEMEILAYRNQINPHFLYNTLSCMRDMALINDEDDIAEMAMCLSDIFRYAVKGSNIVTVRDEVEYIEKYATIINHRFMGKIRIHVTAADDVLDKPVIRLFLQPLVENSVFHGLEVSLEPGVVDVTITKKHRRLEMVVKDNGCGIDEDKLHNIRLQLENPGDSASIGLSNIVQRLRLFYGTDYSLAIDSAPGEGTMVTISVPEQIQGEDEQEVNNIRPA